MTNMRERIRRVLEEECYVGPYTSDRAVDKVLEALTEPTEEMRKAGWVEMEQRDELLVWSVMIAAASAP